MIRCWLLSLALVGAWVSCLGADTFDRYTNPVLSQVEGAPGAVRVNRITPELALQNRYLSDNDGMLVIARTQSGLHAKLLVKFARQRFGDRTVPIAILDRVTTYKAGQERVL
ncbi:MAG TPA: hypothetical protein PKC45_09495, partial [Gemmatales bacterium]|nr:hypothetical protein [Gemmatales bacterium]